MIFDGTDTIDVMVEREYRIYASDRAALTVLCRGWRRACVDLGVAVTPLCINLLFLRLLNIFRQSSLHGTSAFRVLKLIVITRDCPRNIRAHHISDNGAALRRRTAAQALSNSR
jgi:hypothetical protein